MRTFELEPGATPSAWGQAHGEQFRGEIQSLAALRMYLTVRVGGFPSEDSVRAVAERHLPILRDCDRPLYDELIGIAHGAGLSPAEVVVVNHYTDLRDIDPNTALEATPAHVDGKAGGDPGGCSILWTQTQTGPILAQTWDMHATAIPYVMMLKVPEGPHGPEAWLFTLTGCLGMTGLNRRGVGIAINNLHSTDARVGLVWPALVRRVLREHSAAAGLAVIQASPIGSGHHYLVADRERAIGVETSGTQCRVMFESDGQKSYVHTNHCLDPEVAAASRVPEASTTYDRYNLLAADIDAKPVTDLDDAWRRLGSQEGYPRSVCTNMATPENPHRAATCGAIAMEPQSLRTYAQAGLIHNVAPARFAFSEPA